MKVFPCGEVCREKVLVMTVSCSTEFGDAQFRSSSFEKYSHPSERSNLISATGSGQATFTSLEAWHAVVVGM